MARGARTVFAGLPHHITQRGDHRENVFFMEEDRRIYLEWLEEYCRRHEVEILAYCLMTNHIHLACGRSGQGQRFATRLETPAHALCPTH